MYFFQHRLPVTTTSLHSCMCRSKHLTDGVRDFVHGKHEAQRRQVLLRVLLGDIARKVPGLDRNKMNAEGRHLNYTHGCRVSIAWPDVVAAIEFSYRFVG